MQAAIDAGVNFFDTAPMYGDGASETLLGKFLAEHGLRQQTVIATKIRPGMMKPDQIQTECEDSLKRLQTDYLMWSWQKKQGKETNDTPVILQGWRKSLLEPALLAWQAKTN